MKKSESIVFKGLTKLPYRYAPLRHAVISPLIRGIIIYVGYIALCFAIAKSVVRIINKQ